MSEVAQCVDIALSDLDAITDYAKKEGIDMLVVGPEVPLTEGLADLAQSKGLAVFGPNKAAAQMEGSKVFAKNLMKKYHVPTQPTLPLPMAMPPRPILKNRAHPSSSKPTAWLPAKASSSPRRKQKPSKRSMP